MQQQTTKSYQTKEVPSWWKQNNDAQKRAKITKKKIKIEETIESVERHKIVKENVLCSYIL